MLLENGVLIHDDNDGATLRYGVGSDGSDLDGGKLVVVNTSYVNSPIGHGYDANIISCNTTISTSIYQSTT